MVVEVVIIFCRLCSILRLEIWQVYAHLTWTIHLTNYHFHIISRSRVQSFTYCHWLWHCEVQLFILIEGVEIIQEVITSCSYVWCISPTPTQEEGHTSIPITDVSLHFRLHEQIEGMKKNCYCWWKFIVMMSSWYCSGGLEETKIWGCCSVFALYVFWLWMSGSSLMLIHPLIIFKNHTMSVNNCECDSTSFGHN